MKTLWEEMFLAMLMGMVLPGLLLSAMAWVRGEIPEEEASEVMEASAAEPLGHTIALRDSRGEVTERELEAYLVGVVLAEMPASFEPEALKAQAVVARTYTLRAEATGGKHGDGSICTLASCCQAYLPEGEYLEKGGTDADLEKVRRGVSATAGQVLTYEGELIEATYFSCSGGRTEDAAAVWGTEYPYLRSVESPGEEASLYDTDTVTFTAEALQQALGVTLSGDQDEWFSNITYTPGNGVDTVTVGGTVYRGTELRQRLGLRSTAFTVEAAEDGIIFHTRGYGHRVGMSQYGAEVMAVSGSLYPEILAHYYPGTQLEKIS